VPPSYWYLDKDKAWRFPASLTEISPGPPIPPIESLKDFHPRGAHLWPMDKLLALPQPAPAAGVKTSTAYRARKHRYGKARTSATTSGGGGHGLRGRRAMFRGVTAATSIASTGVIQWMAEQRVAVYHSGTCTLTRSPSRVPASSNEKALCEPLHVQYSTTTVPSWWTSATNAIRGLKVTAPSTTTLIDGGLHETRPSPQGSWWRRGAFLEPAAPAGLPATAYFPAPRS